MTTAAQFSPGNPVFDALLSHTLRTEQGHKAHETGYTMTDEQLAALNAAVGGSPKDKSYRPYCLNVQAGCSMPRVALRPWGFECFECGNRFGFDLHKI